LALAARQGARGPRQIEVLETDIDQEAKAVVDLLEDAAGDLKLLRSEVALQIFEPVPRGTDGHGRDLGDVATGDLDRQGFGLEARAAAGLARGLGLIPAKLLAHPTGVGLAPAPLQVRQNALEGLVDLVFSGVVVIDEVDLVSARSVQNHRFGCVRQLPPGLVHGKSIVPGERLQGLGVKR
jgi:hypothetical protein